MSCNIQNGDRVMVTDDGFVCLFNDDDNEVIRILNTIFASARPYKIEYRIENSSKINENAASYYPYFIRPDYY
jgi:hypothetical protein